MIENGLESISIDLMKAQKMSQATSNLPLEDLEGSTAQFVLPEAFESLFTLSMHYSKMESKTYHKEKLHSSPGQRHVLRALLDHYIHDISVVDNSRRAAR